MSLLSIPGWLRRNSKTSKKSARKPISRFFRPNLEELEQRQLLAILNVSVANVDLDPNGKAVVGTLRWAIDSAKAGDEIDFTPTGTGRLHLDKAMDPITVSLTINGYSQGAPNTNRLGGADNANIVIVLDGSQNVGPNADGLDLQAKNTTIKGLEIINFPIWGIYSSADGNTISGNKIHNNKSSGVVINAPSGNNTIGGTTPAARNWIYGNGPGGISGGGIVIEGGTNNLIQGNYIGTDPGGNTSNGVLITTNNNTVGGTADQAGNVISSNVQHGIMISGSGNLVQGNLIGTDITGMKGHNANGQAYGNGGDGILIYGGSLTTVGGAVSAAQNVISANVANGIEIYGNAPGAGNSNTVEGNYIGVTKDGSAPLANGGDGVKISDGSSNTVGGVTGTLGTPPGNVISANGLSGVEIYGDGTNPAANNQVEGNVIGTDPTGKFAKGGSPMPTTFGNGTGVKVSGGATDAGNEIGSIFAGGGNLISNNSQDGVFISATKTTVIGNYIGTDITGLVALGNGYSGIEISTGTNNNIGGTLPGEGNIISGNGATAGAPSNNDNGITIHGTGNIQATGNQIQGNYIGTNVKGTGALKNSGDGIYLDIYAQNNTIGGSSFNVGAALSGAGNLISANGSDGVEIDGNNNTVAGNFIGTDNTGTKALGNGNDGVYIDGSTGASSNIIGGTTQSAGNLISANKRYGVEVASAGAKNNIIQFDFIGLDVNGNFVQALINGAGWWLDNGTNTTWANDKHN